jgi:hypothetical protein
VTHCKEHSQLEGKRKIQRKAKGRRSRTWSCVGSIGLLRSFGAMGGGNQGSDIGMTPGEEEQCSGGRGNATADVERREKLVVMMQRMSRGILIHR